MEEESRARGKVLSVNVGGIREFDFNGQAARSGIWKFPAPGRVRARGVNLEGDDQADRAAHGGPNKAIYAYAIEDYRWWQAEIDRPLQYGEFGENLTTEGIDVTGALVGERFKVGTTLLEVSEPRVPCWRFGVRMGDPKFPRGSPRREGPAPTCGSSKKEKSAPGMRFGSSLARTTKSQSETFSVSSPGTNTKRRDCSQCLNWVIIYLTNLVF